MKGVAEMSDNMIKAIGINKYFGKAQVLKDISLSAARGDIYGLIGKNGAGKTTFMRILAGLMKPSSGLTETAGRVSFLPQNVRLRDHRNAAEVIRFYAALRHSDCSMGFALAEELELDMTRKVRNLSPGQQRKLQLVIAAIGRPEIMILDEPTAGLDPMGVRQVRELVRRMNGQGCTFLISSHVLMELDSLCTNAAVIDSGKLLYQGTCTAPARAAPPPPPGRSRRARARSPSA
jgi:ABC-2 type transport system ATP-binding protein